MSSDEIELQLIVTEADADPERMDYLTVRLLRDLQELGVESVERAPGEGASDRAKGGALSLGAFALAAAPAFLPKLVDFAQGWSQRGEGRIVRIKTAAGLEVEFTPERRLSQSDILALVEQLSGIGPAPAAAPRGQAA